MLPGSSLPRDRKRSTSHVCAVHFRSGGVRPATTWFRSFLASPSAPASSRTPVPSTCECFLLSRRSKQSLRSNRSSKSRAMADPSAATNASATSFVHGQRCRPRGSPPDRKDPQRTDTCTEEGEAGRGPLRLRRRKPRQKGEERSPRRSPVVKHLPQRMVLEDNGDERGIGTRPLRQR